MVDMHDHRKRKRVLHVNMLKKFNTRAPEASCYTSTELEEVGDIPSWKTDTHQGSKLGDQLQPKQVKELKLLLTQYRLVFSGRPGKTDLAEHQIETEDVPPIRLPAYRLPQAYRSMVKEELDEMLESGIIEQSKSEWSSPIVLVPKKDGRQRMCVDYRTD